VRPTSPGNRAVPRAAAAVFPLLPGVLIVYLSFNAGGFFPGTPAAIVVLLALTLLVRVIGMQDPFSGLGVPFVVAVAGLAGYVAWTLLSAAWSDAPARAVLASDVGLVYLLTFVVFGSARTETTGIRRMIWAVALGATAVCMVALITRTLPDLWPTHANLENGRLSYPLTYWNALGLLASVGLVLCAYLTTSGREPPLARLLAAAAVPVLATTQLLTFSLNPILAGAVGLVAYFALGRPRLAVSGLLATIPTTAVAVVVAYHANLLASDNPASPAAAAQGHRIAVVVGICVAATAALRWLLHRLDARLLADRRRERWSPRARRAAIGLSLVALLGALLAVDAPGRAQQAYDEFLSPPTASPDQRGRLSDPSNNGRLLEWRVALREFDASPLHGGGAGTYELAWERYRPNDSTALNAHSLYLETLAELGVVGLLLLVGAILAILGGMALRVRGPDRALYAAVLAAGLMWTLHAGFDWDWQMPAVTLWFFALGAAALSAAPATASSQARPSRALRVAVALGVLVLAITPARVAVSQARLDRALKAFQDGDCGIAIDTALGSISAWGSRPEPYELIGYCDVRLGPPRLGVRAMADAVRRDPDNWETHYGLAYARAAAGLDPRPAARAAQRLNPHSELVQAAVRRLVPDSPGGWRRAASRLRVPVG